MRILHTSDWHLGRQLHKTRQRYEEFGRFLDFLAETVESRRVECLIVAGDVFDTTTPSNRAQALYYDLLRRLIASSVCRHVVIVAGNHDSPTFLEAPARLLSGLGVHVTGRWEPESEPLVLRDPGGRPELVVCAVPFLREGDLRSAVYERSADEDRETLAAALAGFYRQVRSSADRLLAELGEAVPVLATGHLFVSGGLVEEGDGVREIHAGPLEAIPAESLPLFDYVALGHLHGPQRVGGSEMVRYSGSPLAMGFGEGGRRKSLCLVDLAPGEEPILELVEIPEFQKLARLKGDLGTILAGMRALKGTGAWLELIVEGGIEDDPRSRLEAEAGSLGLEIVRIRDQRFRSLALAAAEPGPDLAAMEPADVFESLMEQAKVPDDRRAELRATHAEVLRAILEDDVRAE